MSPETTDKQPDHLPPDELSPSESAGSDVTPEVMPEAENISPAGQPAEDEPSVDHGKPIQPDLSDLGLRITVTGLARGQDHKSQRLSKKNVQAIIARADDIRSDFQGSRADYYALDGGRHLAETTVSEGQLGGVNQSSEVIGGTDPAYVGRHVATDPETVNETTTVIDGGLAATVLPELGRPERLAKSDRRGLAWAGGQLVAATHGTIEYLNDPENGKRRKIVAGFVAGAFVVLMAGVAYKLGHNPGQANNTALPVPTPKPKPTSTLAPVPLPQLVRHAVTLHKKVREHTPTTHAHGEFIDHILKRGQSYWSATVAAHPHMSPKLIQHLVAQELRHDGISWRQVHNIHPGQSVSIIK